MNSKIKLLKLELEIEKIKCKNNETFMNKKHKNALIQRNRLMKFEKKFKNYLEELTIQLWTEGLISSQYLEWKNLVDFLTRNNKEISTLPKMKIHSTLVSLYQMRKFAIDTQNLDLQLKTENEICFFENLSELIIKSNSNRVTITL